MSLSRRATVPATFSLMEEEEVSGQGWRTFQGPALRPGTIHGSCRPCPPVGVTASCLRRSLLLLLPRECVFVCVKDIPYGQIHTSHGGCFLSRFLKLKFTLILHTVLLLVSCVLLKGIFVLTIINQHRLEKCLQTNRKSSYINSCFEPLVLLVKEASDFYCDLLFNKFLPRNATFVLNRKLFSVLNLLLQMGLLNKKITFIFGV